MDTRELTCGNASREIPATSTPIPAENAEIGSLSVLYVSTDLSTWRPQRPEWIAHECQINDRCYRRLDPEYFAWLKLKMHGAKAAGEAGRVPAAVFDELRLRFNDIQVRAIELFGEQRLLNAVRRLDAEKYRPPLPDEFERPKPVGPLSTRIGSESEKLTRARRLVDEIQDEALALGWSMDNLYYCEGYEEHPIGRRYGLVCYVSTEEWIGEVTRQSIELIGPPPLEVRSRFYNRDVDQPWLRRVSPAAI
jgi:hypothetical protein